MEKRARSAIDLEVDSIRPAHAEAVWLQDGIGAISARSLRPLGSAISLGSSVTRPGFGLISDHLHLTSRSHEGVRRGKPEVAPSRPTLQKGQKVGEAVGQRLDDDPQTAPRPAMRVPEQKGAK